MSRMKKIMCALMLPVWMFFTGCASQGATVHKDVCVKLGQEWTYKTRTQEADSRAIIVEAFMDDKRQRYYIVRVTGVNIDHPNFKNYFSDNNAYFVLTEQGLQASLVSMVGDSTWNPFFDRPYQTWRKALKGPDYLGLTISEKLKTLEEILNTKIGA